MCRTQRCDDGTSQSPFESVETISFRIDLSETGDGVEGRILGQTNRVVGAND
jgi:hypothetical protein